jgi:hypothetical protein
MPHEKRLTTPFGSNRVGFIGDEAGRYSDATKAALRFLECHRETRFSGFVGADSI